MLKDLIPTRFRSRRAFIRAAEPKANQDGAQAYLTRVLTGAKPPPIERIEAWATALRLTGDERRRFTALAAIAHIPEEVRPQFEIWYDEHQRLKADYAELVTEVRRVAEK